MDIKIISDGVDLIDSEPYREILASLIYIMVVKKNRHLLYSY